RPVKTKPGNDRLSIRNCFVQSAYVVARFGPQQKTHGGRAVSKGAGERLKPELRDLIDLHRQYILGQSITVAGERLNQRPPMVAIMKQQHGLHAATIEKSRTQYAQP